MTKDLQTHNTTETKQMLQQIFGNLPEGHTASYDCFIQILFKDVDDYIRAKDDPYYRDVIFPDHANFADPARTTFVTGWVETHISNAQLVSIGTIEPCVLSTGSPNQVLL